MDDVDFFHSRLGRLKVALGITKDKEAAEALGLSEKALNARKARGSFPEKELYALTAKRPELNIDVDYVLTGISSAARSLLDASQARLERASNAGLDREQLHALLAAQGPGPNPLRLAQLQAMLPKLRAVEFEAVFETVQSIVSLREALEKTAADTGQTMAQKRTTRTS